MTIHFKQMPMARRTPGRYLELNTTIANRGLVADPVKLVFIGQRFSTGTQDALSLTEVASAAEAHDYYGRGSLLDRMFQSAFGANPYIKAYGLPVDDHGSGVARVVTLTITGPATASGSLSLWVGGQRVDLAVTNGDVQNTLAANLQALLTAIAHPDLPITATVATNVVTCTARNKGTVANDIDFHVEMSGVTGVAVAIAQTTAGATDPSLQAALDSILNEDFDFIVCGNNDATNLGLVETHVMSLVHPLKSLGALAIYATSGTLANATTLAANFETCGFLSHAFLRGTPTWDPELAAIYAAVLASQSDPALPYNNLSLTGAMNPWSSSDKLIASEVEALLYAGVSPLVVGAGDQVRVVRAITTYVKNDAGANDDALLDVTTPRTLFFVRKQVATMLALKYPQAKNTQARRDAIRQDLLALLFQMEDLEIVEAVEANKDGVVVEVNGSDPTRCDIVLPTNIVDGLHVLAIRIDLTR